MLGNILKSTSNFDLTAFYMFISIRGIYHSSAALFSANPFQTTNTYASATATSAETIYNLEVNLPTFFSLDMQILKESQTEPSASAEEDANNSSDEEDDFGNIEVQSIRLANRIYEQKSPQFMAHEPEPLNEEDAAAAQSSAEESSSESNIDSAEIHTFSEEAASMTHSAETVHSARAENSNFLHETIEVYNNFMRNILFRVIHLCDIDPQHSSFYPCIMRMFQVSLRNIDTNLNILTSEQMEILKTNGYINANGSPNIPGDCYGFHPEDNC